MRWLATPILATVLLLAPGARAQTCTQRDPLQSLIGEVAAARSRSVSDTARILSSARELRVPWHQQRSRFKCTHHTLAMVLAFYHLSDPDIPHPDVTGPDGIYEKAIAAGAARRDQPGMTMEGLQKTAAAYGMRAEYLHGVDGPAPTVADLKRAVAEGVPPIIAYWAGTLASPRRKPLEGEGNVVPHAAVIEGFFTDDDGQSWVAINEPYYGEQVWTVEELRATFADLGSQVVLIRPPTTH